ncbi:MAG: hypothetical protein G01um101420_703 [Parcubacteria group bacterium Gr01-1014_20]|nr:MAG: hypothetical protein G01um101420_703 [Parcubacteria group bacterium Gr01-1014_20]
MTKPVLRSWGVDYHIATYSSALCCVKCGWRMYEDLKNIKELEQRNDCIVGFELQSKLPLPKDSDYWKIGIVVVECQKCFDKFWHHATKSWIENIQRSCKNWPKEP